MLETFQSFSRELKFYLLMNNLFGFGIGLSSIFLSVFLWKIDENYTLLAEYSLYWSIALIIFFGACAWLSRKTTPMFTMRLGFLCYLLEFLTILYFNVEVEQHIFLIGMLNGLAMSLYYVGVHLAMLDLVPNGIRDKFLYLQEILFTISGIIAPLVSGFVISKHDGMSGYYVVFALTCVFFFLALLASSKVKGSPVSEKSHFWDVVKSPSPEWKKMYKVMVADGIVSGTYTTFLITMMTFSIVGDELSLSIYQASINAFTIGALYLLARFTNHNDRLRVYSIGAILLAATSIMLSSNPELSMLVVYGMVSSIALNMLFTSMNALLYESIERDPHYQERRLDYIIIREIPLGVGRIIGILMFLAMQSYLDFEKVLPIAFALFPLVYMLIVPMLYSIWNRDSHRKKTMLK